MKFPAKILVLLATAVFSHGFIHAQCVPDTENCTDTGDPGQFCPAKLPKAGINVLYDEVVTVIPPGSFEAPGAGSVPIAFIEIDSVKNLPPGIDYFPNASRFYPDTAYCIQLTGTATETGEFPLHIYIAPYIDVAGTPTLFPQVRDTSSIVMTVVEVLGIDPNLYTEFEVFQNVPNPFSEVTRLAFFTPFDDRIELKVYNILGLLVHQELKMVSPGTHYFDFDGGELMPGTYLYRVENSNGSHTAKFIKSR